MAEDRPESIGPTVVKPKCVRCNKNNAQEVFKGLCRRCYDETRKIKIPRDLSEKVSQAQTTEDFRNLAVELAPAFKAIAQGEQKASTAQTQILKDIWARAYGKPTAIQEKLKVAAGLVVLPVLDTGENSTICPRCGYDVTKGLEGSRFEKPKDTVATKSGATDGVPIIDS